MPLRHVQVPPGLEPAFAAAESLVAAFFSDLEHTPETASLHVRGERYLLVRASSLSVEFFGMVRDLFGADRQEAADRFARQILFDLAHAIGRSDARHFIDVMGVTDPVESLSSGPVHFAWTGWASVHIHPHSRPVPDARFELHYDHPFSFESASWLSAGLRPDQPVCTMGAGYSSGWCTEAFGLDLVAVEVSCRACGDPHCRFVMAPRDRIEAVLDRTAAALPRSPAPTFLSHPRVEEELRASRDALEARVKERTAELEAANRALREEIARREHAERLLVQAQRLEALGRLASGLAHDLNNLLAIVAGRAELLRMQAHDPEAVEKGVDQFLGACRRVADLTRKLTTFSRGQPAAPQPLDLTAAVHAAVDFITPILGDDVDLTIGGDDGVVVLADPTQVDQVILNLVTNARQAMPHGGTLTLETATTRLETRGLDGLAPGDYGVLRVTDTGRGMDEETLDRALEPFFTTRRAQGGSGLGLSTVYGIATCHGGTVALSSTPGTGTTVSVYLPLTDQPPSHPTPAPPPRPGRVLVVEGQDVLREFIVGVLEHHGLDVLAAPDAATAGDLLTRTAPIDVVVTDVTGSGRDLSEALPPPHTGAAAVYFTGDPARLGIDGDARVLHKPFTATDLWRAVQQALTP